MKKTTEKFALLLRNKNRDIKHGDNYGKMEIAIVDISTGVVRNPGSEHAFNDLSFRAQWDTDGGTRTYGWEAAYRDVYIVRLAEAKRMFSTLQKIERAYLRANIKPITFGQYVTVVSLALGIKHVMKESIHSLDVLTYSEREFQHWDIQDAAFLIDGAIQEDREKQANG